MNSREAFGTYHPAINFALFAFAIALGMFMRHPAFLALGVVFSASYYLTVRGRKGLKVVLGMIPLFAVIACLNPVFNTMGDTVLFTYFGRPYTFEALMFGMATAAMFVGMMLWFGSYNAIMTSDKFTYLFGRFAPSLSLVFTMVLRLVPNYQRKIDQLVTARNSIGKDVSGGDKRERISSAAALLSVLTSWAFENAVVVADSMRSRGYGLSGRTTYSLYRFEGRDKALIVLMALCVVATVACMAGGALAVEFIPAIVIPAPTPLTVVGFFSYAVFLSIPTFVNLRESVIWRISLSKI